MLCRAAFDMVRRQVKRAPQGTMVDLRTSANEVEARLTKPGAPGGRILHARYNAQAPNASRAAYLAADGSRQRLVLADLAICMGLY